MPKALNMEKTGFPYRLQAKAERWKNLPFCRNLQDP